MSTESKNKRSRRCPGCGGLVTTAVCVGCKIIRDATDEKHATEAMNPGGSKAVKLGCLCLAFENRSGKGRAGHPERFVIVDACKIHGKPPTKPVETKSDIPPPIPEKHWAII